MIDKKLNVTIAVIIPCYKVRKQILDVINEIGPEVTRIYVIDDSCPEHTGLYVKNNCTDERVTVITHDSNQGVGGAVLTGYQAAIDDNMQILVKIDGDGQMNPALIENFVRPIIDNEADYTKGNRFYYLESLKDMPRIRLIGNAALSFLTKLSSGYWNIFDPTNGFTAIHANVVSHLPVNKISKRYFFESDMLFRLNTISAVVVDIPMDARYADEVSNLHIPSAILEFTFQNMKNFLKRIFYNYYLRDMTLGSFELPVGIVFILFGLFYGSYHWLKAIYNATTTPAGTVMLAALPIIIGIQFILSFLANDIASVPTRPISGVNIIPR